MLEAGRLPVRGGVHLRWEAENPDGKHNEQIDERTAPKPTVARWDSPHSLMPSRGIR